MHTHTEELSLLFAARGARKILLKKKKKKTTSSNAPRDKHSADAISRHLRGFHFVCAPRG